MGIVKKVAKEVFKEIDNKSREFYEFVLPPVDLQKFDNELILIVDMPGFEKDSIEVTMNCNILAINAKKNNQEQKGTTIWNQRPKIIDKKMMLPISVKEGEEKVTSAKYSEGILTVVIPITKKGVDVKIE